MRGYVAISSLFVFSVGCAASEPEPAIGPVLATPPRAQETAPVVAEQPINAPDDIYAGVEETTAVVEGLCFLDAPGVTAQVAPFDDGVGLAVTSDHVDRLRADARILAERLTSFSPPDDERVFVAGSDEPVAPADASPIEVSIEVQDAPGGVMFVVVPDDPRRAGELMRRLSADANTLGSGACDGE